MCRSLLNVSIIETDYTISLECIGTKYKNSSTLNLEGRISQVLQYVQKNGIWTDVRSNGLISAFPAANFGKTIMEFRVKEEVSVGSFLG